MKYVYLRTYADIESRAQCRQGSCALPLAAANRLQSFTRPFYSCSSGYCHLSEMHEYDFNRLYERVVRRTGRSCRAGVRRALQRLERGGRIAVGGSRTRGRSGASPSLRPNYCSVDTLDDVI